MGGFFGERKNLIMALIPEKHKVFGVHVQGTQSKELLSALLLSHSLSFPLVAKPNVGERGDDVRILYTMQELLAYGKVISDYLIQEYICYPLEVGVLFYKYPNSDKGVVSSITQKNFLRVKGNGQNTIEQLLNTCSRNKLYTAALKIDFPKELQHIPESGHNHVVHRIGNHSKGTRFIDANQHINAQISNIFNDLSQQIDGFYYGRFDIKVPSFGHLQRGENIKIFELNGVSSEPGHMYDQTSVFKAYRILAEHWLVLIKIAHQNIKRGEKTTPILYFVKRIITHFSRTNKPGKS